MKMKTIFENANRIGKEYQEETQKITSDARRIEQLRIALVMELSNISTYLEEKEELEQHFKINTNMIDMTRNSALSQTFRPLVNSVSCFN